MKTILLLALLGMPASVAPTEGHGKLDPSSPKAVLLSFQNAVPRRDWTAAQRCLASDVRETLKDAIADRSFFDQFVTDGFKTKTQELIPVRSATE